MTEQKPKNKIVLALVIISAIWVCMFTVDYNRTSNLKHPLFCPVVKGGATADDGGSGTFIGPGYTVTLKKQLDSHSPGGVKVHSAEMKIFGRTVVAAIE